MSKSSPKKMNKKHTINGSYFLLALFGLLFLQNFIAMNSSFTSIPFGQFMSELKAGKIGEIFIGNDEIKGLYSGAEKKGFKTKKVDLELAKYLQDSGVIFKQINESTFWRDLMSWTLPTLLFIGVWFFIIRKMAEKGVGYGAMSLGKSKAKVYVENDTGVRFSDVAGVDEAKGELIEIIDFLKDAKYYGRLGGRMPKGTLLVGPPGTGKTLLAKAVAGEAKVPFFSISGPEFVEMFVGVGAARVRDLFEQAKKSAPCIIFIDELDALGKARGNSPLGGGNDEKEQTLNQLLTELDGFDSAVGIILLAATNRPEILDPALLRSGRFDRQVLVDRPDKLGRKQILQVHVKKIKLDPAIQLEEIAALTTGFTGADLANLTNEAALVATRADKSSVELMDFTKAIERIIAGLEKKNRLINDFERKVTAYHEIGHAIIGELLGATQVIHKVSIIPRGMGSLGHTIQRPTEDRFLLKKEELENRIAILLAGRASEKLIFSHLSTGASDDLAKATDLARSMACEYGMVENLGSVSYAKIRNPYLGELSRERNYSDSTAKSIDDAIKEIIDRALARAYQALSQNIDVLHLCSSELMKKETLDAKELQKYFLALKK